MGDMLPKSFHAPSWYSRLPIMVVGVWKALDSGAWISMLIIRARSSWPFVPGSSPPNVYFASSETRPSVMDGTELGAGASQVIWPKKDTALESTSKKASVTWWGMPSGMSATPSGWSFARSRVVDWPGETGERSWHFSHSGKNRGG